MVDSQLFRAVMGRFATGITVVTTDKEDRNVHAMTANAFTSVSLDPPLVLVSVAKTAAMHGYLHATGRFGISFLDSGQSEVSNHFAGRPDERVGESVTYNRLADIPVLEHSLARIACRRWAVYDGGDHTLFVGEVIDLQADEGEPLLYFRGRYGTLVTDEKR